jgi:LCP family protein required for cell wall assembly
VAAAGGLAFRRIDSTISVVRSVSTPPPQLEISPDADDIVAAGGDPTTGPGPTVLVDTGPAVAALTAAGATGDGGGERFGGLWDTASNFADLTRGAAVVAGVDDEAAPALTILMMGVDARPGEPIDVGVRPDVLMVVRLDPVAGECRLLSIPRDTRTELPGYGESKVNHALMVGGIPYEILVVEKLLGIEIDRYALMDFAGFEDVVDHFGGITINVPKEVGFAGVVIPAGRQELNGAEALAYARYRDKATEGDAGRIRRQWTILRGIGEAIGGRDLVAEVNALLPEIGDHIRTDLSATELAAIADGYGGRCTADTVEPAMLDGTRIRFIDPILNQNVYYNVVDDGRIEERVAELMGT